MADVTINGITGEAVASATRFLDNVSQPWRLGARGSQIAMNLFNGQAALAMEGSYYIAATPTPGTGVTLSPAAGNSFSDTQALVGINNLDTNPFIGGQGRCIYLDFITVIVTVAGASATSEHFAHRIDAAVRNTAGTVITGKCVHGGYGTAGIAELRYVPTVAAATNAVRNVGRNTVRSQICVIQDSYTIKFGAQENAAGGGLVSGAAATNLTVFAPAVVIPPGWSYTLNEWSVARAVTALSGELIVGYWER